MGCNCCSKLASSRIIKERNASGCFWKANAFQKSWLFISEHTAPQAVSQCHTNRTPESTKAVQAQAERCEKTIGNMKSWKSHQADDTSEDFLSKTSQYTSCLASSPKPETLNPKPLTPKPLDVALLFKGREPL